MSFDILGYKLKKVVDKCDRHNMIRNILKPYCEELNFKPIGYVNKFSERETENYNDVNIAKFYDDDKFNQVRFFKQIKKTKDDKYIIFFVKDNSVFYDEFDKPESATYDTLSRIYDHFKLPIVCDLISKTINQTSNRTSDGSFDPLFLEYIEKYNCFSTYTKLNDFINCFRLEHDPIKDKINLVCYVSQLGYYTDDYKPYPTTIENFEVIYREQRQPLIYI